MVKLCLRCGKEFKTYHNLKYCGRVCQFASQVRALKLTCLQCGKEFIRSRTQAKKSEKHYCSPGCLQDWRRVNQIAVACKICGKIFYPKRAIANLYCSKECRSIGKTTAKTLICQQCGKPFRAFASQAKNGRRFCSHECSENWTVGRNHPNYVGGKCLAHGSRWERIRKEIIERDKVCRWCGAPRSSDGRSLFVHHIDPRRRYLIVDMANEKDNLVALCDKCHGKVDMAIIYGHISELPKFLRPPA